jgi:DNA-binding NtrC family response regulator
MQVKLLRALQESEISRLGSHDTIKIDIRIIAATNRNLEIEVSANKFRQDLYFRLNVLTLKLPPLREREKDILLLADYFNSKYCQQFGVQLKTITLSAQNRLTTYNWPGNVRELENIIQKAILHTSDNKITSEQIDIAAPAVIKTLKEARAGAERELIHLTLKKTSGNISLSAKLLDIDRKWLMKIMEDLGIIIDDYRK